MSGLTPLGLEIAGIIRQEGPISLERYMALCLGHPIHGYYVSRDPLGRAGDFTTAPEISQMFGELIGLWVAEVWNAMGRPGRIVLAELGPGRGTLVADALRAMRILPECLAALDVNLVETSPVLERRQREMLAASGVASAWHRGIDTLPPGPVLVVANEFLDALPVRQFERMPTGWHERLVGLDGAGGFSLGAKGVPEPSLAKRDAPVGSVLEIAPAAAMLVGQLARRLVGEGGAALFIDYGHLAPGFGDTLQAISRHAVADPLRHQGEVDLTSHVDFSAMAQAASAAGTRVHGPVTQGDFLTALGINARAVRLGRDASPADRNEIEAARHRLTSAGPIGMGALFKVLGLSHPALVALPGFPSISPLRPPSLIDEPSSC